MSFQTGFKVDERRRDRVSWFNSTREKKKHHIFGLRHHTSRSDIRGREAREKNLRRIP